MYMGYNLQGLSPEYFASREVMTNHSARIIDCAGRVQCATTTLSIKEDLDRQTSAAIDGSKLQSDWFPQTKADIFISHSHDDTNLATALAGWLYQRFQLTSFIDSCVWKYANDLLKQIDDKHCKNEGQETYNYDNRNRSTANVHMMLASALCQMINQTECLIFLSTDNSIKMSDTNSARTHSPWLLMELGIASVIARKKPDRLIQESVPKYASFSQFFYGVEVQLEALTKINESTLENWVQRHANVGGHPLDVLYKLAEKNADRTQSKGEGRL